MKTRIVDTGYTPRAWQDKFHRGAWGKKRAVLVVHRRGGKTVAVINEMVDRGLNLKTFTDAAGTHIAKNPQFAYIAPTYGQAKRIAWQYLKDACSQMPGYTAHEQELRVDITAPHGNGRIRFMLLGAENADSIRGMYMDGVILDEYADYHPDVWSKVVSLCLADRDGWAIFIGTPKGSNDFKEKYDYAIRNDSWFTMVLKASESGLLRQETMDQIRAEIGDDAYEQEMECSFAAALTGSYYAKYIEEARKTRRVREVPWDPSLPVNTYWDLGVNDMTFIWFRQQYGKEYRYIDCLFGSGPGLDHYAKIIKAKPYAYGRHVLPHDGAARSLETGRTRQDFLRGLGIRVEIQGRQEIADGIQAARTILPLSWFDEDKCKEGLDALTNYSKKWDSKNKYYLETPLHNWASNGADAFRISALDSRQQIDPNERNLPRQAESSYNELDY